MEFRHLKCMVAVADHLSFKHAAEQIHLTQPALSICIKQLEQELNTELFLRTSRSVHLSDAGRRFYPQARYLLRQMEDFQHTFQKAQTPKNSSLRIGSAKMFFFSALEKSLAHMLHKHPEIRIETLWLEEGQLHNALHTGQVDLIYSIESSTDEQLEVRNLEEARLHLAMHCEHPLASQKDPISIGQLQGAHLVLARHSGTDVLAHRLQQLLVTHQIRPASIRWVSNMVEAMLPTLSGCSLCFAPGYLKELGAHLVTRTFTPEFFFARQVLWRKDNHTPALQSFISSLDELAL